jgi:hypothetical protein
MGAGRGAGWLGGVSILAAAPGKETALSMLVVLPLQDLLFRRTPEERAGRAVRWAPVAAAGGLYLVMRLAALRSFAPGARPIDPGGLDSVLNLRALAAHYAGKLIAPIRLTALYGAGRPIRSSTRGCCSGWRSSAGWRRWQSRRGDRGRSCSPSP